jgi:hypothetical protein
MKNKKRTRSFQKESSLEKVFPEMARLLIPAEQEVLKGFTAPQKPIFLILGCARSGTTLLFQYLAKSGALNFPTNLVSRFYYAPYIGMRIQQMLIDYDYNNEVIPEESSINYSSNLGKTKGAKAPHEFWYFWRRFFQFGDIQKLTKEQLREVNWPLLLSELAAMEAVYQKPLLMKGMNLNWNLLDVEKNIPNVHFIHINRETLYNAQSLLLSRKKFFDSYAEWYSFRPPKYNDLKDLSPEEQVVQQVKITNHDICSQLDQLPRQKYTQISYESLCKHPFQTCSDLVELANPSSELTDSFRNYSFSHGNTRKVDVDTFEKLELMVHRSNE